MIYNDNYVTFEASSIYIAVPCRFVVPPVPGFGGSDIFPGPGAGMYPSRFLQLSSNYHSLNGLFIKWNFTQYLFVGCAFIDCKIHFIFLQG